MKPDSLFQIESKDVQNTYRFESGKGYFIIEAYPIMTENQILCIEQEYTLVEFKSDCRIDYKQVVFWYASSKDGILKLICYDFNNKIVIQKIHDIKNPDSDWFLISEDFFDGQLLEFDFN